MDQGLFEKDGWKLLSSHGQGAIYTETLVMEIPNSGCVMRVITIIEPDDIHHITDSISFVPWAKIEDVHDGKGMLVGRKLANFNKF